MKMVELTSIEQIQQTAFEENIIYEIEAVISSIFTTKTGFNLIKIYDGKDYFSITAFEEKLDFEIEEGTSVRIYFRKTEYNGELQGKLVKITPCESKRCKEIQEKLVKKKQEKKGKYLPKNDELAISTPAYEQLKESLLRASEEIKKAIINKRPIIISHHADADGYSSAILIEDAIKKLIYEEFGDIRYLSDFIQSNPSKTPFYDIIDATKDINFYLSKAERTKLSPPLLIILDNGSTAQDLPAIRKVKTFGFDVVVLDHHDPGQRDEHGKTTTCKEVLAHVNPHLHHLGHSFSASMLAYQEAKYIFNDNDKDDEQRTAQIAVLGAIADKCEGKEVDILLKKSTYSREEMVELAKITDYEIYQTKFNHVVSSLKQFMKGSKDFQKKIIELYSPLLLSERENARKTIQHYAKAEQAGNFSLFFLDGEQTTQWSSYFGLRHYAALLNEEKQEISPRAIMVYSSSVLVIRANPGDHKEFDVNSFVQQLKNDLPYAQISGGGHNVAGSIKFIPAAKEEVLRLVKEYIEKL